MADNTTLDAGAGGDVVVTREISHGGDTSKLAGAFLMGITGTEGSYTAGAINGDATNGLDVDVTRLPALVAGTANIGDVDVLTLPALPAGTNNIGDVDIASIAAGDNNIGNVDVVTLPAVTNAGTFAVQVDGSALTALELIDDPIFADDAAFTLTSSKTVVSGAIRDDTLATLSAVEGDVVPLRVSSTGALHVTGSAGTTQYAEDTAHQTGDQLCVVGAVRRDSAASSSATDGDYVTLNTNATGALRVTVDSIANSQTDDAAFTPGTSLVSVVGAHADEGSTDSVDEGDAGALRMTLDRKLIVTPQPHTIGGLSIFRTLDADETEEDVKTTAGQVYGMWVTNTDTATAFVKFYNATAANVTVGTTAPVITIGIPGNSSDDVSGNFGPGGMGIAFDTAISVAAVAEAADNGTTGPAANSVILNIFYK